MSLSTDVTGSLVLSPHPVFVLTFRGRPPFSVSFSCFCTRVSVHRRDWCTCASSLPPLSCSSLRRSLPPPPWHLYRIMPEHVEAQQAAADGLNELGIQATLWYSTLVRFMHRKVSCLLHRISCTPRLQNVRPLYMLSHRLVQRKVLCVHFILCSKLLSLSSSVMPIRALLKSRPRFLILATSTYLRYGKSGKSRNQLNTKDTQLFFTWSQ